MKIEPQPVSHGAKQPLEWLAEKDNHGLDESGLSDIIRLLIVANNHLQLQVEHLQNRVNQLDSFH